MISMYQELSKFGFVLKNFVMQELTVKYKRSFIGFFWSLLNPILTMTISSIVFGSIMKFELKDFAVFIFSGLLPFNFFGGTVQNATVSLINAEGYIKKVYIPKLLFPMSMTISNFINMLFSMTALFVIMIFISAKATPALFFLPVSFLILFLFTYGVSLMFSIFNVYFRDFNYLVGVLLSGLYYMTPVLYPVDYIKNSPLFWVVKYNPMTYIIDLFRNPIYLNKIPPMDTIGISLILALSVFVIGNYVFKKYEKEIIFYL